MTHLVRAALVAAIVVLIAPNTVFADDYLSRATKALERSNVYVEPGTENTTSATDSELAAYLTRNDDIVLVMLPASAQEELGMTPTEIAVQLSLALDDQRIIGLAVGNEVVGYAAFLPDGIAEERMRNADEISYNNPKTALGTFVNYMHAWQASNPRPAKPTPEPTPEPTPTPRPTPTAQQRAQMEREESRRQMVSFGVIFVATATILIAAYIRHQKKMAMSPDRTKFEAPDRVSDLLTAIARMRPQVKDKEVQDSLTEILKDIEVYFRKYSSNPQQDARSFENHLRSILDVVIKYVEVQDYQRYYEDPSGSLAQGKGAIKDFAEYVLKSCKRGSAERLMDYTVNTKILSAQRFR